MAEHVISKRFLSEWGSRGERSNGTLECVLVVNSGAFGLVRDDTRGLGLMGLVRVVSFNRPESVYYAYYITRAQNTVLVDGYGARV